MLGDVAGRMGESPVHWEPPVVFSAITGKGKTELRRALAQAAERAVQRSTDDLFRMPVDRVFSVAGAGTVVTGTTWSGSIATGDLVRVLPGGGRTRVRSVEVHGQSRERAEPGRRTALALPGLGKGKLARGCVVVADDAWQESSTLDVLLTLLPEARALTQRSRVRLHVGTAEVMARVTPAGREIGPGSTGAARLRLEKPLVARWGDRGVVRSYSPVTTVGGCVVVDPWPPPRPRRPVHVVDRAVAGPAARVRAFVETAGHRGLPISHLPVRAGIHPGDLESVVAQATGDGIENAASRLVAATVVEQARAATLEALAGYHQQHPLEPGMPRELLRSVVTSPELADHVHDRLAREGRVAIEGGTARLADFRPRLSDQQAVWMERVRAALTAAGSRGRTGAELADEVPAEAALQLAGYLVRQHTAVRVGKDRYYDRSALDRLRDDIVDEVGKLGRATPAQLRKRTGLTRKYLIPVLEWLDGAGYTVREGDTRRVGPAASRLQ